MELAGDRLRTPGEGTRISWTEGTGRESWKRFTHGVLAAVNSFPGGPKIRSWRSGDRRYPVGMLAASTEAGGEWEFRLQPGQSLLIREWRDPDTWSVR